MLIHHSPHDSWVRMALAEAEEAAKVPTVDKIRARQEHYDRMNRGGGDG